MSRRFRTGLVVGKLFPLHRGHELLIGRAVADCDAVVVLSYSRPELPRCGTARRRAWLASLFPTVHAIVLEGEEAPPNDAPGEVHRRFVASVLAARGRRIDAVFSSEDYGEPLANELHRAQGAHVSHVMVDRERVAVPVSVHGCAWADRTRASFRARAHEWYRAALSEGDVPWCIAEGSLDARIRRVLEHLEGPGT